MTGGRRPAPTNVKLLHGVRASRINTDEPMPHEVEPEPPKWATDEWLAIWGRTCDQLRGMGILYAADREGLVAFVTAVHEHDRLAKVLVRARAVVRDANGQPVANPLGRTLRQASGGGGPLGIPLRADPCRARSDQPGQRHRIRSRPTTSPGRTTASAARPLSR